ncbi:DotU family type IV/VI secretion system protein [Arenibaculum pallidiluteum]|uniref:DotU family type IV/VI secretion system protein n=1 Tax=Arenibaculum pallidiluteum TaxID=2812559 RepID=UPI001A96D0DC|nr:DotU family type IV/VI secretion system protein [Arenibaculum pallidiluteum]
MTTEPTLLGRRDILDCFLAFAAELARHRASVESRRARRAPAPELPGLPPAEAVPAPSSDFPAFLLDAPVMAAERPAAFPDAATAPASAPPVDPEVILERLQAFLETQAAGFGRRASDVMLAQYREAQYAMAALADDVFLHEIEWDGREVWRLNHLEQRLFRSRLAGDRIFERMDALLASGDRRLLQLASVYLCILSLGFKGRHRGPGGDVRIRGYAERLFEMLSGREPDLLGTWSGAMRPLVPAAYAHTVRGDAARRGRWHPRWPMVLAGVLAVWLLVGQALWMTSSSRLSEASGAVLRAAGQTR